jgi:hypothetical protein
MQPPARRFEGEDYVLACLRDIHLRINALMEDKNFIDWIGTDRDPDPNGHGYSKLIEELRAAERLFGDLRAGRAIATDGGTKPPSKAP